MGPCPLSPNRNSRGLRRFHPHDPCVSLPPYRFCPGRMKNVSAFPFEPRKLSQHIVAIPAHNEAERIAKCLAALAMQRDGAGAPVAPGAFGVLLYANNCADDTVSVAHRMRTSLPYPLELIEARLDPSCATAGGWIWEARNLRASDPQW
jgi:hypothetical protein